MKYDCDIPGLDACFVEFSDSWSRLDARNFYEFKDDAYLELVFQKMTGCYLVCPGSEPITEPFRLTSENLDRIDLRLVFWLSSVPLKHVQGLGELGEAFLRRLYGFTETKSNQASDAVTQS